MAALLSPGPRKIRLAGSSLKPTHHLVARSAEAAIHSWAGRRPHWRQRIRRAVSGLVPMFIGLCTESAWMFVEELKPTIWSNLSLKWLCVRVGLPCLSFAFPSRSAVFHPVPAQSLAHLERPAAAGPAVQRIPNYECPIKPLAAGLATLARSCSNQRRASDQLPVSGSRHRWTWRGRVLASPPLSSEARKSAAPWELCSYRPTGRP
jgi:hypothetical protein